MTQHVNLLIQLAALLRQAGVYELSNTVFATATPALVQLVHEVGHGQELVVDLVAGSFFINQALVKAPPSAFEAQESLKKTFERLGAQRLRFPAHCTQEQVLECLALAKEHFRGQGSVIGSSLPVRFATVSYALGGNASIDARQNVLRLYARLTAVLEQLVGDVRAGRPFHSPRLRKAIQSLAQGVEGHEALLAGLTCFPNFQGAAHFHLAATAALTLLMGRRLGLARSVLVDVVTAAAAHEFEGAVGPGQAFMSGMAPFQALLTTVRDGLTEEGMLQGIAALESRAMVAMDPAWTPSGLGRLVAVPCAFDRLTSGRDGPRLAPDQAMRSLVTESGLRFDPRVVRLFIATVGVYPIGSAVRLSSGELAVILAVPASARAYAQPVVKIVRGEAGTSGQLCDLSVDPQQRTVVACVDMIEEDLNPTSFLLA